MSVDQIAINMHPVITSEDEHGDFSLENHTIFTGYHDVQQTDHISASRADSCHAQSLHHGMEQTHHHQQTGSSFQDASATSLNMVDSLHMLKTSGMFLVLLLLMFIYDHRLGLMVIVAMAGTFFYCDQKLVHCIRHSAARGMETRRLQSFGSPSFLIIFLAVNICLIYFSFQDQALWRVLLYKMPVVPEVDIWILMWVVFVTDFVVKFATVSLKCCLFLLPEMCLASRRKGGYYQCVEHISQFYRHTLTVLPWIHYLYDNHDIGRLFAIITVVIYLVLKLFGMYAVLSELMQATHKLGLEMQLGSALPVYDLKRRGLTCPICQDDFKDPISLACQHIFCEQCALAWFDHNKTCPMCRTQIVQDDLLWRDGATSAALQWF